MDVLKAALKKALSARGKLVMLAGEPGVGKTRLARQIAAQARQQGALVLWGKSYAEQEAPPYWPWVQAIRSYVRSCNLEKLEKEMGFAAPIIAEIVEDIKARMPDTKPPRKLENVGSARFRLFDAVSTFLKNASFSQPLVVVLDDLHWSDGPSLKLLEFVSHELEGCRPRTGGPPQTVQKNAVLRSGNAGRLHAPALSARGAVSDKQHLLLPTGAFRRTGMRIHRLSLRTGTLRHMPHSGR